MATMAQSAANWRNPHTHVDRTHSLTHLHRHSYNHVVRSYPVFFSSCVQCFRVSVIHRSLARTTGSLTCVRDHSIACVYTRGLLGQRVSTTFLTRKNSPLFFLVLLKGFEARSFGSWVRRSTHWATLSPQSRAIPCVTNTLTSKSNAELAVGESTKQIRHRSASHK